MVRPGESKPESSGSPGHPDRSAYLSILAVVLLVGVSTLLLNAHHVRPPDLLGDGDISANGLLIRDARDMSLGVGPYSRLKYNHPGPVTFYYLAAAEPLVAAVPSPLGRQRIAMLIINLAGLALALSLIVRVTGRNADIWLLAVSLIFTILPVATTGHHPFLEFWGPLIVIIPTLVFGLALGPAALGRAGWWPVLCLSGVFAAHNHLFNAVLVAILGLGVAARLAWLGIRHRLPQPTRKQMTWLALGLAFVVLTSVPTLVDEFGSDEGNLQRVLTTTREQHFQERTTADTMRAVGWAAAVSVTLGVPDLAAHIGLVPWGLVIGLLLVWSVAGWLQYRRAGPEFRAMILAMACVYGLSFVIATQTRDNPVSIPFVFHFTAGLAAFFFFLVLREAGFQLARLAGRTFRGSRLRIPGRAAILLSAVVMVVWMGRFRVEPMPGHEVPEGIWTALPAAQDGPIRAFLRAGGPEHFLWPQLVSFVLQAEQRGYEVLVPCYWPTIFRRRVGPGDPRLPTVLVSEKGLGTIATSSGTECSFDVYSVLAPGGTYEELERRLASWDLEPLVPDRWVTPDGSSLEFRSWWGKEFADGSAYRWNRGSGSSVFFGMADSYAPYRDTVLEMNLGALGRQSVQVSLNGRQIADLELNGFREVHTSIPIPAGLLQTNGGNELLFHVPNAASPAGADPRVLGVRFIALRIIPATGPGN
ncbi:hypothetical protein DRQ50_09885 [bacterium]|nr:MAG: hypothetical protein DRQ50_09885 [bacterium]